VDAAIGTDARDTHTGDQEDATQALTDDGNGQHPESGTIEGMASTDNRNGNGSHAGQAGESRLSSAELYRRSDEALNLAAELHSLAAELQAQGL